MLAGGERPLIQQHVIAAAGVGVKASGGTGALSRAPGEGQSLTLIAPAPVVLAGIVGMLHQHVVAAAGVIVSGARGAMALIGATGEVESLALVAPAPVVLSDGWSGQAEIVDRQREIGGLARRPAVHVIHVADGRDVLNHLVGVQNVAGIGVHDHLVLALEAGVGEENGPAEHDRVVERKPDQAGLDFGAKRSGLQDGRLFGSFGEGGADFRSEAGDVDGGFRKGRAELIFAVFGGRVGLGDKLGGFENGIFGAQLMRRAHVRRDADDIAGRVFQGAVRTEADQRGAFENGNPLIALLQIDRMSAAAGLLDLRVGYEFRGLAGSEAEYGPDGVDVLKRPLNVILGTAGRRGCRHCGWVSGAGVDSAYPDFLHARHAGRQFVGFTLQESGSLRSRPAAGMVPYIYFSAHKISFLS